MPITSDWHIHSKNSCDTACLKVADLVAAAAAGGIRHYGLTDHVHTPVNYPDLRASREEFRSVRPAPHFHFGVEASCVSQWELDKIASGRHGAPVYGLREGGPPGGPLAVALDREFLTSLEIEYVVGGTHWPMYVEISPQAVIRDYHRQNLYLATHPLVDIVAHPWWWMGHWQDAAGNYPGEPWFDDFGRIPQSMHAEFAAAAVENGTVVEINLSAILLNPQYPLPFKRQYLDYLAGLKARGVSLSVGSDCHSAEYAIDFETAARMLEEVGITDDDLWIRSPRPEPVR